MYQIKLNKSQKNITLKKVERSVKLVQKISDITLVQRLSEIKLTQKVSNIQLKQVGRAGAQGVQGEKGDTGASGSDAEDKNFVQEFTNSAQVTVTHNLNKYPAVTVTDSTGDEVVGAIEHISINELVATFVGSFTGRIVCN